MRRSTRKRQRNQRSQIKRSDPWGTMNIRGVRTLRIRKTEEGSKLLQWFSFIRHITHFEQNIETGFVLQSQRRR